MGTSTASSTIILQGRSGAKYEFQVYPWGTNFKALGAVYAVLKATSGTTYAVLYVGETGNLSERFDDHHKAVCFDRHGRTHIAVCVEPSHDVRLRVEQDLVANYNPPCNG